MTDTKNDFVNCREGTVNRIIECMWFVKIHAGYFSQIINNIQLEISQHTENI